MKISTPRGCAGGAAPLVQIWDPPRISETITARRLKFYTHLDRTKCNFRAWQFPLGCAGGSGGRPGGLKLQCPAIATFSSLFITESYTKYKNRHKEINEKATHTTKIIQHTMQSVRPTYIFVVLLPILHFWLSAPCGHSSYKFEVWLCPLKII